MEYSKDFKDLLEKFGETNLINGSFVWGNVSVEKWERMRGFIVEAINQDGTILDIGCANGFLLRCLQEWSNFALIPYGIDVSAPHIKKAQEIFPQQKSNFAVIKIEELANLGKTGLPNDYKIVFWGVWDNWFFDSPERLNTLKEVFGLVEPGGRLILTFYSKKEEMVQAEEKISQIKAAGYQISGRLDNSDRSEIAIWIDKS